MSLCVRCVVCARRRRRREAEGGHVSGPYCRLCPHPPTPSPSTNHPSLRPPSAKPFGVKGQGRVYRLISVSTPIRALGPPPAALSPREVVLMCRTCALLTSNSTPPPASISHFPLPPPHKNHTANLDRRLSLPYRGLDEKEV